MRKRIDLTGEKFNRLTVLQFLKNKNRRTFWTCACACGKKLSVRGDKLKDSHTQSCGCQKKEKAKLGKSHLIHGKTNSRTYTTWLCMKQRCKNSKHGHFKYYGGRGVLVCKRWADSFVNFLQDMGERPEGKTLDRIDVNGSYEKSNCRWATHKEQCSNKRMPPLSLG